MKEIGIRSAGIMTGTLIAALVMALAVPGLVFGAGSVEGVTDTSIKIGFFGPKSGPAAYLGRGMLGARMYFDDVNTAGGINGRKIELVEEDDQANPAQSIAVVTKLINRDKVFALFGGASTSASTALVPLVAESKVPWVIMLSGVKYAPENNKENIFLVGLSAKAQGAIITKFAVEKLKAKKIAVVRQNDLYGKDGIEGIKAVAAKYPGVTIVADETLEGTATDASAQVLKVKASSPDVVLLPLYAQPGAIFLRQKFEMGLKMPTVSFTAIEPIVFYQKMVPVGALEKTHYSMSPIIDDPIQGPLLKTFREKFKKKYPETATMPGEPTIWAPYCYGTAMVMVEGLKRAGRNLTREGFIKAMETIKGFDTKVISVPVTHAPGAHRGAPGGKFWTVRNGKITVLPEPWFEPVN